MKTKLFFGMVLMALFTVVGLTACSNDDDDEGKKIIDHKEYTITVASAKLQGVLTLSGFNTVSDVYAVKIENSTEWEAFGSISNFDYEEGYEYKLRISETTYLDNRMGDPVWTERKLLEVISKVKKDSENLPIHFIPDWYFRDRCMHIDPNFDYAIDADKKDEIENDLKTDPTYNFGGLVYYLVLEKGRWYLQNSDMETKDFGIMYRKPKDIKDLPESYKLLPPNKNIFSYGLYVFAKNNDPEDIVMEYDTFIYRESQTKTTEPQSIGMQLYKDLTTYYKNKFPEAKVKGVVIRYEVKENSNS